MRKNISISTIWIAAIAVMLPLIPKSAEAATTFSALVGKLLGILNAAVPVLIGLAVMFLIYGILKYMSAAGDPKKVTEGGKLVIWGVVILFIMVSFWGFVNILIATVFGSTGPGGFTLSGSLWR